MKESSFRFYISVTGAALAAGTLLAVIVYDPHNWLGFRNLIAVPLAFLGGAAITWQALAIGGDTLQATRLLWRLIGAHASPP